MSADPLLQSASGTMRDGEIPARPLAAPPAPPHARPGVVAALVRNPTQTGTVGGVLLLALIQLVGAIRGDDLEKELQAEIERREDIQAQKDLLESTKAAALLCAKTAGENAAALEASWKALEALDIASEERAAETLEFQAEIAQYTERAVTAFSKKLHSDNPETGQRFDEYVRKGLMRRSHRDAGGSR